MCFDKSWNASRDPEYTLAIGLIVFDPIHWIALKLHFVSGSHLAMRTRVVRNDCLYSVIETPVKPWATMLEADDPVAQEFIPAAAERPVAGISLSIYRFFQG